MPEGVRRSAEVPQCPETGARTKPLARRYQPSDPPDRRELTLFGPAPGREASPPELLTPAVLLQEALRQMETQEWASVRPGLRQVPLPVPSAQVRSIQLGPAAWHRWQHWRQRQPAAAWPFRSEPAVAGPLRCSGPPQSAGSAIAG